MYHAIFASAGLQPVTTITIAVLVVSVALAAALSVIIARRNRAPSATPAPRTARQKQPQLSRSAVMAARAPVDVQDRLQRLMALQDAADAESDVVERPHTPRAATRASDVSLSTQTAGTAATPASPTPPDDATRFFSDGPAERRDHDATAFFTDHGRDLGAGEDATRFFSDNQDAPGATTFFAPDAAGRQDHSARGDATQFFNDSATPSPARAALPPASGTTFFGAQELQVDEAPSRGQAGEGTGMLYALPPMTKDATWDTVDDAPTSNAGGLKHVRDCLAAVAEPQVLALSVLDSAGRVLAGETDDDLTGELRSLMAESGQGNTADIEQPVHLADNAAGAIILLPTGANALLGALVRDEGDPQVTRARLRGLAHEIGDAIHRAS